MVRGIGLAIAGTLLLTTVGCSFDSFSLSVNNSPHDEQVVNSSLKEVKARVENNLLNMKLAIIKSSKDGNTVRITSKSPAGEKFVLVLKQLKAEKDEGERTSMRIDWEKKPDPANEMFWNVLVTAVSNPASVGMSGMYGQQQFGAQGPQYGVGSQQFGAQGPQYGNPGPQYGVPGPQYGNPGQQQMNAFGPQYQQ